MKKNKNRKIITLIPIALAGFLLGLFGSKIEFGKVIFNLIHGFEDWMLRNSFAIMVVGVLGLSLIAWIMFYMGKSKVKKQLEEDADLIDDDLIGIGMAINGSIIIVEIVLFVNYIRSIFIYDGTIGQAIFVFVLFFLFAFLSILMQKLSIDFTKTYNPEIYDGFLDMKFNKKYIESVDEREQVEIYRAGYKAYQTMSNMAFIFLVIGCLISLDLNGSILSALALALVIIGGIISYTLEAMKK